MTKSARSKPLVAIISLIILAFLAGLIFCFAFANRYFIKVKQNEMLEIYNSISSVFDVAYEKQQGGDSPGSLDDAYDTLAELCDEKGITVYIMNPAGNNVFAYGNPDILRDRLNSLTLNLADKDSMQVISKNNDYTAQVITDNKGDIQYLEMWGFFTSGNSFIIRTSSSGMQNSIRISLMFFCFVCMVIVIIAGVIIYVLAHSYSKPLRQLVSVSKKASELDFGDIKYDPNTSNRKDEIGLLGANISEMSVKLEKTISELKSSNLKLKNELKAKAELEEQRKKYISDVSHELKTPIALIAGYAEGLKEGVGGTKEDQEFYVDVIIDEAEKMNMMVKRISSLNKLEQGQGDITLERFDVVEVINGYLNTMALIFEEKGVDIYFNNKNIVYVWSDEFLFEEVLMNYINNALNHVDEKKTISINAEPMEGKVRVTVYNTGKCIPEEDIDKIWGEFYKVDKARTRAYGGSGLGLSIVKAIADAIEQECGVYNTDDGVAFWIDLELDKVQVYNQTELQKRAAIKLSDLPIWQTTTKILKDTSERMEAAAKEREEKETKRKEEQARHREEQARHKEEAAKEKEEKAALRKETQALKKESLVREKEERAALRKENQAKEKGKLGKG